MRKLIVMLTPLAGNISTDPNGGGGNDLFEWRKHEVSNDAEGRIAA